MKHPEIEISWDAFLSSGGFFKVDITSYSL
jgi:hypothetical protein